MEGFLAALEASSLARGLRASFYLYPLVNAAHIAAVGVLLTSVFVMHARAIGFLAGLDAMTTKLAFRRIALTTFALAVVTGVLLFIVNPVEYAANPAFRLKLLLLALAGLNLAAYLRWARWTLGGTLISALLWPAILIAGRFIGFV